MPDINLDTADKLFLMRHCALFSHLSEQDITRLSNSVCVKALKEKDHLFHQGQAATDFFLVTKGELKLAISSPTGQEKILHILRAGDTFAEALMFLEKPVYPAAATAISNSTVLICPAKMYKTLLAQSPDACFGILGEYSQRIRNLVGEIESLTTHNATFRVVRFLLKEIPENQSTATSVQLSTPKHAIASRLSITPETLSRILAKLKNQGVIHVTEKRLVLNDISWMRDFISQG